MPVDAVPTILTAAGISLAVIVFALAGTTKGRILTVAVTAVVALAVPVVTRSASVPASPVNQLATALSGYPDQARTAAVLTSSWEQDNKAGLAEFEKMFGTQTTDALRKVMGVARSASEFLSDPLNRN